MVSVMHMDGKIFVKTISIPALLLFILILIFPGVVSATVNNQCEVMNGSDFSEYIDVYFNESNFQGFIYCPMLYNDSNSSKPGINENHSHERDFSYNNAFLSNAGFIAGGVEFNMSYQESSSNDEIEAGIDSFLNMNTEKSTASKPDSSYKDIRPYTY